MARGSDMDLDRVDGILMQALENTKTEHVCVRCRAKESQLTGSRDGKTNGREIPG